MTLQQLFNKNLKEVQRQGKDHTAINTLCGCTERKIVLTEAEAEAGRITFNTMMVEKLWNDLQFEGGWLFGSPKTQLNIGLVPSNLAKLRLGLNRHCWDSYIQVS